MKKKTFFILLVFTLATTLFIEAMTAPFASYRLQKRFFLGVLPVVQNMLGITRQFDLKEGVVQETKEALEELRTLYQLDQFMTDSQLQSYANLMHWVRDQFPHGTPHMTPKAQSFDAVKVLQSRGDSAFFCGTAAQILVQAIQSVGGFSRRVELRFLPNHQHAVVEAWIQDLGKWVIFDPDYDIYYEADGVPQNALELHKAWASGDISAITVVDRDSRHNIYQHSLDAQQFYFLHSIFKSKNHRLWQVFHKNNRQEAEKIRFSAKLLNYYSHFSIPMRTDWKSRPLKWWHPEGNHFQNSLVINTDTMPHYEDFSIYTDQWDLVYDEPNRPQML